MIPNTAFRSLLCITAMTAIHANANAHVSPLNQDSPRRGIIAPPRDIPPAQQPQDVLILDLDSDINTSFTAIDSCIAELKTTGQFISRSGSFVVIQGDAEEQRIATERLYEAAREQASSAEVRIEFIELESSIGSDRPELPVRIATTKFLKEIEQAQLKSTWSVTLKSPNRTEAKVSIGGSNPIDISMLPTVTAEGIAIDMTLKLPAYFPEALELTTDRMTTDSPTYGVRLSTPNEASNPTTSTNYLLLVHAQEISRPEVDTLKTVDMYIDQRPTRDGIGTRFFGREIAQVMGHLAAGWLERPNREQQERTDVLVKMLPVQPDHIVADIGAGSGYFTSILSLLVPNGQVMATDIQPEMLEILEERIKIEGLKNVKTVLGTIDDTGLQPSTIDLILLVDVYHEFDHPWKMLRSMYSALKPNGVVAIVEYRANDPNVPIKPLHTMTKEQVQLEFELAGFSLKDIQGGLPWQRLFIFEKPAP